ncbi:hypothetical protein SAMN04490248_101274 [Salinihabitans flavidus]|uniref:Sialate O-acetylesterase domain-containing protein n=1 Tax=Salinihabitans flavidus TaxID=569882 RepID=A0A1H8LSH4_9RHOB|nr:hypothetical protein [Salinihabitans flavidus]SEO08054.1 hypothetical protein SAMN04490248_101274 [Salinihabitans flavidus]
MTDTPDRKDRGVLLRARNGDVIGYDATGLRMTLSDAVVADLGRRLGAAEQGWIDPAVLGDIDAWSVAQSGEWYLFDARLPGAQGVRRFRRRISLPGDAVPEVIADPAGALFAILSLGGARRAVTGDEAPRFGYHVVTTGDDLGPAGAAGTEAVQATDLIQRPREQSRDSLIADEIVARRHGAHRALPVIYARAECDSSASVGALLQGAALANFRRTVQNLVLAAGSLGLPAKVLSVGLDFTLEDVVSDGATWRRGMYDLMAQITDIFADHGLRKPLFTLIYEAGTADMSDGEVVRAQWEMAWNRGGHDIVFAAPGYMFAQDRFGRPTAEARVQMAEMEAAAIEAVNADEDWTCPLLLLAEREGDGSVIRCRGQGMGRFILDHGDPMGAGTGCGFRLEGATNGATITDVSVAKEDRNDVLIRCDTVPEGDLTLCYAIGHEPVGDGRPANRGALRDEWSMESRTGGRLHRWALPAALPVH